MIVLATAFGLAGFAPPPRRWRPREVAIAFFFILLLAGSFRLAARATPRLQEWEQRTR